MKYLGLVMISLALMACGGGGVNVAVLSPSAPTLMVASKLQTPLYIVLDPARVKPAYEVDRIGTVSNMGSFVSRDLKAAMSEHFATVKIVSNASEITEEPHVVADVKVDGFKKSSVSDGAASYSVFEMTWSFALRPSDSSDYLFSFAGISPSDYRAKSMDAVVSGMLELALTGLLEKWAESGTFGKLQAWEAQ